MVYYGIQSNPSSQQHTTLAVNAATFKPKRPRSAAVALVVTYQQLENPDHISSITISPPPQPPQPLAAISTTTAHRLDHHSPLPPPQPPQPPAVASTTTIARRHLDHHSPPRSRPPQSAALTTTTRRPSQPQLLYFCSLDPLISYL
ncbi:PREDICTED: formin-like protein 14 [Erythranthe guttata]|uniref:formin-like protein 14 n=1 Tax=Erythranthe guttata TaxID=4155 RepID=UPI00064DABC3|nr:PREDICTED: formin-like protein 14 [Erythranthe guttata]|eukprot:XP_012846522.1 PREDICTED: formin-like protein 14 [Erythranthe guttata]